MNRRRLPFRPLMDVMESRCLLSAAAEAVVTGIYREMVLRDPGPRELARFSRVIDAGGSIRSVAVRLYNSNEFRGDVVTSYYEEILGRDPTSAETRRWTQALAAGRAELRVAASIAGSQESFARFGGDNQAYVRSLFVSLLGRNSSASDLTPYVSRLDAGASPTKVATMIVDTNEYRLGKVDEAYQVVLGRAATSSEATALASRWRFLGGQRGVSIRLLSGAENRTRLRDGAVPAVDLTSIDELKQILMSPYDEQSGGFVNTYNRLLGTRPAQDAEGDPVASTPSNTALWALTKSGVNDGRPADEAQTVVSMNVPVSKLIPLQSEVDLDKSLGFLLRQSPSNSDLQKYLAGGVITPFGGAILTGGGGEYIIDGHHRWSSLYVINPDAQIEAKDIGYEVTPQDYLKVAQIAIGAEMGYLPVQSVEGQNLFTINESDFDAWVTTTIQGGKDPQGVLAVFKQMRGLDGIPAVADFLWGNVQRMRRDNQPAPGVTSRDYMPQAPADGLDTLITWFESGKLNSLFPVVARLG